MFLAGVPEYSSLVLLNTLFPILYDIIEVGISHTPVTHIELRYSPVIGITLSNRYNHNLHF